MHPRQLFLGRISIATGIRDSTTNKNKRFKGFRSQLHCQLPARNERCNAEAKNSRSQLHQIIETCTESQYPYFCQNREGWSTAAADLGSARPPSEIDTSSFATGGVSKASVGWLCLQVIFLEVFGLNDESNSWQIPLQGLVGPGGTL